MLQLSVIEKVLAVIGGDDDQGVLSQAPVCQLVEKLTKAPIEIRDLVVVEVDEDLAHGPGQAVVHGEALALPVHRDAHDPELLCDPRVIAALPLPDLLQEASPAEILQLQVHLTETIGCFRK